jgi:hypothetical protein
LGYAAARASLGAFYANGMGGLARDDREALRLFQLAAEQHNAVGESNLGFFYLTGRGGVPKDESEAARLFKLAADKGEAGAQFGLGRKRVAATCLKTIGRQRVFTSSPPIRTMHLPRLALGSFMRTDAVAWQKTTPKPPAFTSARWSRTMPQPGTISAFSIRTVAAGCLKAIRKPHASIGWRCAVESRSRLKGTYPTKRGGCDGVCRRHLDWKMFAG